MGKALYKMDFECGRRMENLKGIFIADKTYIDYLVLNKIMIYFGEVAGKHSEIMGYLEPHEITLVTDDEVVIKMFTEFNLETGFNPLKYRIAYWKHENMCEEDFIDLSVKEALDKFLNKIQE